MGVGASVIHGRENLTGGSLVGGASPGDLSPLGQQAHITLL